jgi:hypothetical protein
MALVTVAAAAVGLAFSTALVAGSSQIDPAEVAPESSVCQDIASGSQRPLPAEGHCLAKTEVQVTPTP